MDKRSIKESDDITPLFSNFKSYSVDEIIAADFNHLDQVFLEVQYLEPQFLR